jgi:[ribosomal protein S5]-alanine N-acetyltransferase
VTREDSGNLLGRMGLLSMALGRGAATCIYSTVPTARGHGVAPRALGALCGWAFNEIGFRRIELRHSVTNAASCRVAAKAGFAGEGILRSVEQHADGWHDVHVHARVSGDPLPPA